MNRCFPRRTCATLAGLLSLGLLLGVPLHPAPTGGGTPPETPGWLGFGYTYQQGEEPEGRETFLAVQGVLPKSPAERAGLEKSDHVTAIDGQPVSRFTPASVLDFFIALEPGQHVRLEVARGGDRLELQLEAAALPDELRQVWEHLLEVRRQMDETEPLWPD